MVLVKNDRYERARTACQNSGSELAMDEPIPDYDNLFEDEVVQRRFAAVIAKAAGRPQSRES